MSQDLVVVVPDNDIEQVVRGILSRTESLGVRPVKHVVLKHPLRDSGCFHTGHDLASRFARDTEHALVVLDLAWDGAPSDDRLVVQAAVEGRLRACWGDRARCVVIDPEVEAWVWSGSPHVEEVLGWTGHALDLRTWLQQDQVWPAHAAKPTDPKTALHRVLGVTQVRPSAALFRRLAQKVSLRRCTDPSFQALVTILREWFPGGDAAGSRRAGDLCPPPTSPPRSPPK